MLKKQLHPQIRNLLILFLIWLVGAISDRLWFAIDRSVPAWDQAEYLTGSLNYWRALQQPQWLEAQWWTNFWQLTTKVPPLTYIATAIVQLIFGIGIDQATLVNSFFSAILLASVYGLGVQLFSAEVGLWAAGLCQLLPALYQLRLDFLLDYPLTAVVTLSFWCLTLWQAKVRSQESGVRSQKKDKANNYELRQTFSLYDSEKELPLGITNYSGRAPNAFGALSRVELQTWLWAVAFGISLGLALLVKQTALFFLFTPVLWVGVEAIRSRNWRQICQLVIGLLISVAVFGPWYRTNWLLIITGGKRATVDSAIAEGDPALNTLAAWTYYWKALPQQVSWLLLIVPIVGLLVAWIGQGVRRQGRQGGQGRQGRNYELQQSSPFIWLAVFWIGAYLLCSLNINKDDRYVLPYLPVVSLFLAYGMTCWYGRWGRQIRWGTISVAIVLTLLNLFPIGGVVGNSITHALNPHAKHYTDSTEWPHPQVIEEIIQTAPDVSSTLGVLPSTPEINQHNLNYYGALRNFQVYGRQVGTQKKQVFQDARSLDWFLTKTGNQGSVPAAQADIVQIVEQAGDFLLHKTWDLPDNSILKLYRRRTPLVEVKSQESTEKSDYPHRVTLLRVTVPHTVPPGKPVPVTYEWSGAWEQLQPGLVLLTWHNQTNPQHRWLHDRGIGMGTLHLGDKKDKGDKVDVGEKMLTCSPAHLLTCSRAPNASVIERMAMLPPADLPAGSYSLEAVYLNRNTGETYPIAVPPVTLKIDPSASAVAAPELDLLTQQRTLAAALPKGIEALEQIFASVARINQYDPIQDYLVQTQLAMEYRLRKEPQNLEWAYALALSQVLQQRVQGAIAALEYVTQLDPNNPYAYAYLAFVHLYNWNGAAAAAALQPALAIKPNLPELHILNGIAALMQGNLFKAWQELSSIQQNIE